MDYKADFFDPFPDLNKTGKSRKKYSFNDDYLNGGNHTNGSGSNCSDGNRKNSGDLSNASDRNGDGDRTPSHHESEEIEDEYTRPQQYFCFLRA